MPSLFLLVNLLSTCFMTPPTFKTEQLQYKRVQAAYQEKELLLKKLLADKGISSFNIDLYIRAFKREQVLEVWVKDKKKPSYVLLKSYPFCETSGTFGPKRKQGDGQIPEGFYFIDRFNPSSNFYLSLGVSYPNAADKRQGKGDLGGDIFIHGDCVTIGCIPLTDDKIKEVYVLAVEAKSGGQAQIPVHIFPSRLGDKELEKLQAEFAEEKKLLAFWQGLKPGYDAFQNTKQLPVISVDKQGNYRVENK
jgi:murein L,D-transpeptidase YafK